MAQVTMSCARAVALLTELVEAFSRKTFQKRFAKLVAKQGDIWSQSLPPQRPIRHLVGRRDLVFKAQRDVLLKYGFSADEEGILAMKAVLRSHLGDPTVAGLSREARVQLRIPQMAPRARATSADDVTISTSGSSWSWECVGEEADEDDYAFLASPEAAAPAPAPTPPAAKAIEARAVVERKPPADIDISVTNPVDKGRMTVTVSRASLQGRHDTLYPTVADVKAAIAAQLGEGAVDPAALQLVVSSGGGVYGIRGDSEVVRLNRVLALGVHMAVGVA